MRFLYFLIFLPSQGKLRPRPGDLIEIFRIGYEHWAIYMEDDWVVHLAPPSKGGGSAEILAFTVAVVRLSGCLALAVEHSGALVALSWLCDGVSSLSA